jgi:uncharacterized protein
MLLPLIRLALVLIAAGAILVAIVAAGMAMALLRPPRMRDGKAIYFLRRLSPQDLDLPYESVHFQVRDQRSGRAIRIAGWWMAHSPPTDRCALILHGYADAKVGGIAWAPLLRDLGFNCLAIDLRAHGESQGTFTTAGFYERYDIVQVIDQMRALWPEQTGQLVLFGVSLGAAAAAATAAMRDDLAAVILESPYLDFPSAVLSHAGNLPVPGRYFQRLAIWLSERIAHADYSEVRPVDMIGRIRCPLLVVQSGDDPFVPGPDQEAIAAAVAAGGGALWRIPECHHVLGLAYDPEEYRRQVAEFLNRAVQSRPASGAAKHE